MKFHDLLMSTLVSFCILGASTGVVMASCGDGLLYNENFDGDLRIDSSNTDCTIISSTIAGDLILTNVNSVVLLNNKVGGRLRVNGNAKTGTATVVGNIVYGKNLVVREMATATVAENEALAGPIRVNQNITARVLQNIASGVVVCKENTSLIASGNISSGRVVRCGN